MPKKKLIKQLAKNPNIKTAEDAQNAIKSLFGDLIKQFFKLKWKNTKYIQNMIIQ